MRFTEIINPEDQLALWRLISDKVWSTFSQQTATAKTQKAVANPTPKLVPKQLDKTPARPPGKSKATQAKVKPKQAPIVPAPKPFPKPKPFQPNPVQSNQVPGKQNQQFAKDLKSALSNKSPPRPSYYPQPTQSRGEVATSVAPITSSYSVRDKDDLVMHRRENPLVPLKTERPHF
jgi:hypothetical protein